MSVGYASMALSAANIKIIVSLGVDKSVVYRRYKIAPNSLFCKISELVENNGIYLSDILQESVLNRYDFNTS